MEENTQTVATEEVVTKTPFSAKLKEWFRKKIVNLKRRPNNIPLLFYAITSVAYLIMLTNYSVIVYNSLNEDSMAWTGLCVFINVLFSLLVLVCMIYAFPKRSKPKIAYLILAAIMTIAMFVCDGFFYSITNGYISESGIDQYANIVIKSVDTGVAYSDGLTLTIVHIVMLGVSAVIFALLPVYAKLIRKIDTSVKLESATENISSGAIDIQED